MNGAMLPDHGIAEQSGLRAELSAESHVARRRRSCAELRRVAGRKPSRNTAASSSADCIGEETVGGDVAHVFGAERDAGLFRCMKVIGTGAPQEITVRFAASEHALVMEELSDLQATMVERRPELQARSEAPTSDEGMPDIEHAHMGLAQLHQVLEQVEDQRDPAGLFSVAGRTWLLAEVRRASAHLAATHPMKVVCTCCSEDDPRCAPGLREPASAASAATITDRKSVV